MIKYNTYKTQFETNIITLLTSCKHQLLQNLISQAGHLSSLLLVCGYRRLTWRTANSRMVAVSLVWHNGASSTFMHYIQKINETHKIVLYKYVDSLKYEQILWEMRLFKLFLPPIQMSWEFTNIFKIKSIYLFM